MTFACNTSSRGTPTPGTCSCLRGTSFLPFRLLHPPLLRERGWEQRTQPRRRARARRWIFPSPPPHPHSHQPSCTWVDEGRTAAPALAPPARHRNKKHAVSRSTGGAGCGFFGQQRMMLGANPFKMRRGMPRTCKPQVVPPEQFGSTVLMELTRYHANNETK